MYSSGSEPGKQETYIIGRILSQYILSWPIYHVQYYTLVLDEQRLSACA